MALGGHSASEGASPNPAGVVRAIPGSAHHRKARNMAAFLSFSTKRTKRSENRRRGQVLVKVGGGSHRTQRGWYEVEA